MFIQLYHPGLSAHSFAGSFSPLALLLTPVWAVIGLLMGKKSDQAIGGFVLGLIGGPLGLLFLALSKKAGAECPFCKETIKPGAVLCMHCRQPLTEGAGQAVLAQPASQGTPSGGPKLESGREKAGKLAVFSVAVLLGLVCLFVLLRPAGQAAPTFSNVSLRTPAAPSSLPAASNSAQYKRDDLRTLVLGKNNDQVLQLLGKPLRTQAFTGVADYWYYARLSYDPVTGETDTAVQIVFQDNTVKDVMYYP